MSTRATPPDPRPRRRVDLKVGFACNNRCVFCAQGGKRGACASIPLDELLRRLASAGGRGHGLVLTGGEPTAYRHIVRLVQLAAKLGFDPIQIQTNGRMLSYAGVVRDLVRAGAKEISPSLHGSTPEVHDALTRAPGSFAESTSGIREAVASGASVVTNSVITRANVDDLPALTTLLASLGVRHAQLAFVHPVGTAAQRFDEVVPRLSDLVSPLRRARQVARERGMRLVTEAVPFCFLPGMEDLAVEAMIPPTTVVDLDGRVLDYSAWREAEGKTHGPPCVACDARGRCEGPWSEYPAKLGWDEFTPYEAPGSLA
jgi:MoaA/NifB/PqqE/SkfB family radical SAM enzyme